MLKLICSTRGKMCIDIETLADLPTTRLTVCECGHRDQAMHWCCVYELLRRSHFLSWEVVRPSSVCSRASCLNVGAALRPKSRFAFYRTEHLNNSLTAVSRIEVTWTAKEKIQ